MALLGCLLPYIAPPCPALPCPAPPCPALPCPALPCPVLVRPLLCCRTLCPHAPPTLGTHVCSHTYVPAPDPAPTLLIPPSGDKRHELFVHYCGYQGGKGAAGKDTLGYKEFEGCYGVIQVRSDQQ